MKFGALAARASLLSLGLALAACGGGGSGGGVSSTPTPPSSGGGTPTPAPAPSNDDLLGPLESENFANQAVQGEASYNQTGELHSVSSGAVNVTFQYDATTRQYTVSAKGESERFGASDIEGEDDAQRVYLKTSGTAANSLVLTKPGAAGALNYRYVGSGFWQVTREGESLDVTQTAFTYGVETPQGGVPVSGSADYDAVLIGNDAYNQHAGEGLITVDFASSDILIDIDYRSVTDTGEITPFTENFLATAKIGRGGTFEGSFTMATGSNYFGDISGQFYGPDAQEVGVVYHGSNTWFDGEAIGTIMGRHAGGATIALSLEDMTVDPVLTAQAWSIRLTESVSDGTVSDVSCCGISGVGGALSYDADAAAFHYIDEIFPVSSAVAAADDRYDVYTDGGNKSLTLYRIGESGGDVELTYSSFGFYKRDGEVFIGSSYYLGYGIPTAVLPESGSASYSGVLTGIGFNENESYDLSGTTTMQLNFGNLGVTGYMEINGVSRQNRDTVDFGTFDFLGSLSPMHMDFSAKGDGSDPDRWASLKGNLYGPEVAELAGVFRAGVVNDSRFSTGSLSMVGSFGAAKD